LKVPFRPEGETPRSRCAGSADLSTLRSARHRLGRKTFAVGIEPLLYASIGSWAAAHSLPIQALRLSADITILLRPVQGHVAVETRYKTSCWLNFNNQLPRNERRIAKRCLIPLRASARERSASTICRQASDLPGQFHTAPLPSAAAHQALSHLRTDFLRRSLEYWSHGATPFPTSGD
jgi:hypothetical protein